MKGLRRLIMRTNIIYTMLLGILTAAAAGGGVVFGQGLVEEKVGASGEMQKWYAMYGVWRDDNIAKQYNDNSGKPFNAGDTVYFSEVSNVPNVSHVGIVQAYRYGASFFRPDEVREKPDSIKPLLAWRTKSYYGDTKNPQRPGGWRDTVDFIFDNLGKMTLESSAIANYISNDSTGSNRRAAYAKNNRFMNLVFNTIRGERIFTPSWVSVPAPDGFAMGQPNANGGYLQDYPDMFWYFGLFEQKLLKDNLDPPEPKISPDNFTDYNLWMSSVINNFYDMTPYNLPHNEISLGKVVEDPYWKAGFNDGAAVRQNPIGYQIVDRTNPQLLLNDEVLFADPLRNKSYNLLGYYKMKPMLDTTAEMEPPTVFRKHYWKSGKITCELASQGGGVGYGNGCRYDTINIITNAHNTYPDACTIHAPVGYMDTLYHKSELEHDYSLDTIVTTGMRRELLQNRNIVCPSPGRCDTTYYELVLDTLVKTDLLVIYQLDDRGYEKRGGLFDPGMWFFSGWYQKECPYDFNGSDLKRNENGEVTKNIGHYNLKRQKSSQGLVTKSVENVFFKLRRKFEELQIDKFVADSTCPSAILPDKNAPNRGQQILLELAKQHEFYFQASEEWKNLKYIDSAWYFANPQNAYLPYENADDFIVRNGYYENDTKFLKLYMEAEMVDINTVNPLSLIFGHDNNQVLFTKQKYYLTFKWPIVHIDGHGILRVIGYIIYNANDTDTECVIETSPDNPLDRGLSFMFWDAPILGHKDLTMLNDGVWDDNSNVYQKIKIYTPISEQRSSLWFFMNTTETGTFGQQRSVAIKTGISYFFSGEEIVTYLSRHMRSDGYKIGNIMLRSDDPSKPPKYTSFDFQLTRKQHYNEYLTILEVAGLEPDTSAVSYRIGGRYTLRDFAADRIDVHDREPWPSEIEKQLMWEIAQKILVAEGINLGMKGAYWLYQNITDPKFAWLGAIGGIVYATGQRIENNKVVKASLNMAKAGWRLHKEVQATLDLMYEVETTYNKIGKMYEGLDKAFGNIKEYYKDFKFEWAHLSTKATQLLPKRALEQADFAIHEFQGSVIDFNRAMYDLTLHVDTLAITPGLYYTRKMIEYLTFNVNSLTEVELWMVKNDLAKVHDFSATSREGTGQSNYVSNLIGGILLQVQSIEFKTLSNGALALSNVLDIIQTESQDWEDWGNYAKKISNRETYEEFWGGMTDTNNLKRDFNGKTYFMPTMSPFINTFQPPSGLFAQKVEERIKNSRGFDGDFWVSAEAWDFVSVDKRLREKSKNNKITGKVEGIYETQTDVNVNSIWR